ncbi:putative glycosyltransferase EpsJ [termite gut metagenome]|uniref:Putative glycosyltransferase EpsJ n=1 Tax=termite gut metagenome TaxID=433724 RepID=A0A5J4SSS2_9ZZZZ
MKISIIIPIYNVADYIERCLLSALNQTYPNVEYILVNDATPDNSMEIVGDILSKHPREKSVKIVHHAENKGLAEARNTGVRSSKGEYVYFLDSDDAIAPDCLETLVKPVDSDQVDFVIGEIQVMGNSRAAYPPLLLKDGIYHGSDCIINAYFRRQWYEMAWNKLIKRSLLVEKKLWFEEGILHEDTLWSFQLAIAAQSMAVTHEPTYIYHIQSNSITQKKSKKNIECFYFVLEKIIQLANDQNLFTTQKNIFPYLENARVYFIKSLLRGKFDKRYIHEQRYQIDTLYKKWVWKSKSRKLEFVLKEFILLLWIFFKY